MLITWDERKRLSNIDKHGFDFAELTYRFFLTSVIVAVHAGRQMAVGRLEDGTIAVVFSYLGTEGLSVVSMRKASKSERKLIE